MSMPNGTSGRCGDAPCSRQPAAEAHDCAADAGLPDAVRRREEGAVREEMRSVSSGVPRVTPSTLNPQARRGGTGIPVAR